MTGMKTLLFVIYIFEIWKDILKEEKSAAHLKDIIRIIQSCSIFYLDKNVGTITITEKNLVLPVPAETVTKTPSITQEPVDYAF